MIKIIFVESQPVITHRIVESPFRIQRTDKVVNVEHLIIEVPDDQATKVLCTLDTNVHFQYLIDDGIEKLPATKWLNNKMKIK